MKFDDFIAAIDRTSPVPVNDQVSALLRLLSETEYMRFNAARAAMPSDVSEAYGAFVRSMHLPAMVSNTKRNGTRRVPLTVSLPPELVDRIPKPRSAFVEQALLTALET